MKILLLVGALFFLALGLVLFGASFADYEDAVANEDVVTELPAHEKEFDVGLMILGGFFAAFGICLLGEFKKIQMLWKFERKSLENFALDQKIKENFFSLVKKFSN